MLEPKPCPICKGPGIMAWVTEDGRWVVTCHGYWWTLTDADIASLMERL